MKAWMLGFDAWVGLGLKVWGLWFGGTASGLGWVLGYLKQEGEKSVDNLPTYAGSRSASIQN